MTTIGNLEFSAPYMNAACSVAKTPDDIAALCRTGAGAVVVGSITPLARDGNPEPRWFDASDFALNSFGMPNGGAEYYKTILPELTSVIHEANKHAILSIAGFSAADYVALAELAATRGVDMLELNFGCPNVQVDGTQKPIASFDPTYMHGIVEHVSATTQLPLLLKLSPYSNPAELARVAHEISTMKPVVGVVTSNTFANAYAKDTLAMEYGGMSGKALHAIAVGQVRQLRSALPETMTVIGVGGIESAEDARDFYDAGASAVQAATLIVRDGHAALDRIAQ